MAFSTKTAAAAPAKTRGSGEAQAGAEREKWMGSGYSVGVVQPEVMAWARKPWETGARTYPDQDVWDKAAAAVIAGADQDAISQIERWRDWWGKSTVPGQTPAYTQEQALGAYLGSLGQIGEQRLADFLADQARGRGGGGGGGGGRRRRGGGGGGAVGSPNYGPSYALDPASLDAWIKAIIGGMPRQRPSEPNFGYRYERPGSAPYRFQRSPQARGSTARPTSMRMF